MQQQISYLPIVIHPWGTFGDQQLAHDLDLYFSQLDGNDDFVSIAPQIAAFGKAQSDFAAQLTKAESTRGKNEIAIKNSMRDLLIPIVVALGVSIQQIAGTNLPMLIKSGAPLRKAPQPVVLELPEKFSVSLGATGELIVKSSNVYGAKYYTARYAANPLGDKVVWQSATSGTSRFVIQGLDSGVSYWVQLEIRGSKNQVVTTTIILSPVVQ